MKRPTTRVEEIRVIRGLTKADLARRSGMPPQTLQNIENGKTKGLSLSARRLLAPVLQVREDQLMLPIGFPIDPVAGQEPPIQQLIYEALQDVLTELREIKQLLQRRADRLEP